jgi:hypothetical protein
VLFSTIVDKLQEKEGDVEIVFKNRPSKGIDIRLDPTLDPKKAWQLFSYKGDDTLSESFEYNMRGLPQKPSLTDLNQELNTVLTDIVSAINTIAGQRQVVIGPSSFSRNTPDKLHMIANGINQLPPQKIDSKVKIKARQCMANAENFVKKYYENDQQGQNGLLAQALIQLGDALIALQ